MLRRRVAVGLIALLAIAAAVRHPTASIEVLTHDTGDLHPHRMQAPRMVTSHGLAAPI